MSLIDEFMPTTALIDVPDRPWVTNEAGIWTRLLLVSADTGTWVVHNRFAPGVATPTHRHTGRVFAVTMSGAWRYAEYDWVARAGSVVHEKAGVTHTLLIPRDNESETEVLFVVEGGNVYFDENGNYLFFQDGFSLLHDYLRKCEEQGFSAPDGIVQ